jgi:hypothetical protein
MFFPSLVNILVYIIRLQEKFFLFFCPSPIALKTVLEKPVCNPRTGSRQAVSAFIICFRIESPARSDPHRQHIHPEQVLIADMGHNIEDRNTHRYDYSNADIQEELYLIMERRPLLAYEAEKKPAKCEAPYSAEKISGTQEYIISRKAVKQ